MFLIQCAVVFQNFKNKRTKACPSQQTIHQPKPPIRQFKTVIRQLDA